MDRTFKLVTIEITQAPEGSPAGRWHRYVIENESTTIYGYTRGSKRQVAQHARTYVDHLNAKNDPSRPKGPWVARKRRATVAR